MSETDPTAVPSSDTPAPSGPAGSGAAPVPVRRGANAALALLAFVLAGGALALGVIALHRNDQLTQGLEQVQAARSARDLADAERERRLADLERQWAQARADGDIGSGVVADAEVRKRREQLAMLDIERLIEQVQLQLRLGTAPALAADALVAADERLARLSGPVAQRVQAALRHDLARLRAAPDIDRAGLVARLDPLLAAVDRWHASADPLHMSARPAPASAPAPAPAPPPPVGVAARVRAWLASNLGEFLRIREVDTPDALLLGPVQQQLLRDRFRLGLLDLRQAIMAHDERAARAEAAALDTLLTRYFDVNQPEVAAALAQLRDTTLTALPANSGSLDETLAALHAARAAGG